MQGFCILFSLIAREVGFTAPNLREQFKRKYGMTPTDIISASNDDPGYNLNADIERAHRCLTPLRPVGDGSSCLTRCAVSGNSQTKKNRPQLFASFPLVFRSIWINFSRSKMKINSHFVRLIEILHYLCTRNV